MPGPAAAALPVSGVARRLLDGARRRFPGLYQGTRRLAARPRALAAWYLQRLRGAPGGEEAYDAAFWDYHGRGDWDGFARLLLAHFGAGAVLDVGCGDGKLLAALQRAAPGLRVLGIDASATALARAAQRGVPTRALDLIASRRREVERAARGLQGFELAVSLETVEHLPPWDAGKLLRLVCVAPVVVFSAAQPDQGGTLHLNERPLAYWVKRFARLGYAPHPASPAFRRQVAGLELDPWYAANLNVFTRGGG